ncbi:hypothetical protein [uncultured Mailhella sp.]|uniref:hypothetical protein n=1 Tax=uncultured Mailhella sp. TaxID=1981031 RepID=UPI00262EA2DC|nr:hypothetical protein [uncultured Mailhella sp.]
MRRKFFIHCCLMLFGLFFLFPKSAFAYIDPAVGSALLQGLAAGFLFIAVFWRRLLAKIKNLFSKQKKD